MSIQEKRSLICDPIEVRGFDQLVYGAFTWLVSVGAGISAPVVCESENDIWSQDCPPCCYICILNSITSQMISDIMFQSIIMSKIVCGVSSNNLNQIYGMHQEFTRMTNMDMNEIERPSKALLNKLREIGTATASDELHRMGIADPFIQGPVTYTPGKSIAGPAVTLQFLPIREDVYKDDPLMQPDVQLHRHAMFVAQEGDVIVVDARGDLRSGVFGDMMLTYFLGKGGVGIVIDGAIRDYTHAKELDLGMWLKGVTPNYHTQTSIFPNAVNVPIACGGTLVNPGDIIIADDDGAVVVPITLAEKLASVASGHSEWETFTKEKLLAGGELKDFYPINVWSAETHKEYENWLKK